jgi:hypothetical protein
MAALSQPNCETRSFGCFLRIFEALEIPPRLKSEEESLDIGAWNFSAGSFDKLPDPAADLRTKAARLCSPRYENF